MFLFSTFSVLLFWFFFSLVSDFNFSLPWSLFFISSASLLLLFSLLFLSALCGIIDCGLLLIFMNLYYFFNFLINFLRYERWCTLTAKGCSMLGWLSSFSNFPRLPSFNQLSSLIGSFKPMQRCMLSHLLRISAPLSTHPQFYPTSVCVVSALCLVLSAPVLISDPLVCPCEPSSWMNITNPIQVSKHLNHIPSESPFLQGKIWGYLHDYL